MMANLQAIRDLNDELRQHLLGGGAWVSPKIAALDLQTLRRLVERLSRFNDFCPSHDRFDDHAFGVFDFEGVTVVFKIDCYIQDMGNRSLLPTEPAQTERVISIMLAEEYALISLGQHGQ